MMKYIAWIGISKHSKINLVDLWLEIVREIQRWYGFVWQVWWNRNDKNYQVTISRYLKSTYHMNCVTYGSLCAKLYKIYSHSILRHLIYDVLKYPHGTNYPSFRFDNGLLLLVWLLYKQWCLNRGHCVQRTISYKNTVYPKKYAHGFVVLCFVVVMQSFIINSHEVFIHIHQGCFAGTGAIVRLPQCQWSKPDGYGKISQCITTTKHSKAKTVCIFLGIYCIYPFSNSYFLCSGSGLLWNFRAKTHVSQLQLSNLASDRLTNCHPQLKATLENPC